MKLQTLKLLCVSPDAKYSEFGPMERLFWSELEDGFEFVALSARDYDSADHCWDDPETECDVLIHGTWYKDTKFKFIIKQSATDVMGYYQDAHLWAELFRQLIHLETTQMSESCSGVLFPATRAQGGVLDNLFEAIKVRFAELTRERDALLKELRRSTSRIVWIPITGEDSLPKEPVNVLIAGPSHVSVDTRVMRRVGKESPWAFSQASDVTHYAMYPENPNCPKGETE